MDIAGDAADEYGHAGRQFPAAVSEAQGRRAFGGFELALHLSYVGW